MANATIAIKNIIIARIDNFLIIKEKPIIVLLDNTKIRIINISIYQSYYIPIL